ncbi:uncharacterized protein METZ01_LOCUS474067, partial [marine metagenome]
VLFRKFNPVQAKHTLGLGDDADIG